MRNSAQRGFAGAWHTIVVADMVSLIGAAVLWYLTVGSVRGFAFFLGLSTLCDLLVAYCFTRRRCCSWPGPTGWRVAR
jgi:preprotein translocase subunit SecD